MHFIGNFSNAIVSLDGQLLNRLGESVFRPMLEQMISGSGQIKFGSCEKGMVTVLYVAKVINLKLIYSV